MYRNKIHRHTLQNYSNKKRLLSHMKVIINYFFLCVIALSISACSSTKKTHQQKTKIPKGHSHHLSQYSCQNLSSYKDKVIGNGTCVSLIKHCSNAPDTRYWSEGSKVLSLPSGSIQPGSVIATFKNGKYPNVTGYHAAIYISHNENGIWVWDQWYGKAVHKRLIRTRTDNAPASNSAQAYSLVK